MIQTNEYTMRLRETDHSRLAIAGGKGSNLGELMTIEGIHVPDGFCVTTRAFDKAVGSDKMYQSLLGQLVASSDTDTDKNQSKREEICARIRNMIEAIRIPDPITAEIMAQMDRFDSHQAWAVRSSATAEDLPGASFAGQQDSYLNVIGKDAVLRNIIKCWASLFTARAVHYRFMQGFDHRTVKLAVVVQQMVFPGVSGVMFTADPITSNRKLLSIDASYGLGEALVSGLVNADNYKIYEDQSIHKKISRKDVAVYALAEGGTTQQALTGDQQTNQVLRDDEILHLARIGRTIELHFGSPQDIEWCQSERGFWIVQSRPITTLYPIPARSISSNTRNRVYISVGHQQMMTDAMRPLGLSFYLMTTRAPMHAAGGRLFVDVTDLLASPVARNGMLHTFEQHDPLIRAALQTIIDRSNFLDTVTEGNQTPAMDQKATPWNFQTIDHDPALVSELISNSQRSIAELKIAISSKSGTELMDFIAADFNTLKSLMANPRSFSAIMTAMNACVWLNERIKEWLSELNVSDVITQSVPNNITSEMGLQLLDVADVIRKYPEVVEYLHHTRSTNFLEELSALAGGKESRQAIVEYLEKYGMRCAGEIDVTRTRWSEDALPLVSILLNNIRSFEPGESRRKFAQGLKEARDKEREILARLQQLPGGEEKARETKRVIDLIRAYMGYREYPKYSIISRFFVYKQALMKEADVLLRDGVIDAREDIYFLYFDELREGIRTQHIDRQLISDRKEEMKHFSKLSPPRVITSDGEIIHGQYNRSNLPKGAIAGLPVSAGIIEGRARVVLKMEDASLEEGDILVTTFTDPSWTPLFVSIKGLVTEVGGLMTHGAVIAREYGVPAVVGVENATKSIKDGQRIRLNGTDGWVEVIS